jgi:hypothetical protein
VEEIVRVEKGRGVSSGVRRRGEEKERERVEKVEGEEVAKVRSKVSSDDVGSRPGGRVGTTTGFCLMSKHVAHEEVGSGSVAVWR